MSVVEILASSWRKSGIEKGDVLFLHSNILRTIFNFRENGYKVTVENILDSFLSAVGIKGTLLFPLFNFNFAKGASFDIKKTPSQMGALTEEARLHKDSVRTGHPIYSFAVIGYQSKVFEKIDNISGYSDESPFGILRKLNGKIGALDVDDQGCMTFYHHVEEIKKVNYRYFKDFTGLYIDQNGKESYKTYSLFVRNLDMGVETFVNPAGEILWKKKLYKGFRPFVDNGLRIINSNEMFDAVSNLIDNGQALGNLYCTNKKNDR